MKSLKESILGRDLVDDYKITLTDDDLKYVFKADVGIGYNEPGQLIYNQLKSPRNHISELEAANLTHQYVEDDKILRKYGFSDVSRNKSSVKYPDPDSSDINDLFFTRTMDNLKGYCVVFNPGAWDNTSSSFGVLSNNIFLVCHVKRRHGSTLNAIEWVCDKGFSNMVQREWPGETHFTDSVQDSLDYIEKKYGKL